MYSFLKFKRLQFALLSSPTRQTIPPEFAGIANNHNNKHLREVEF